jgi:hypothetical protein
VHHLEFPISRQPDDWTCGPASARFTATMEMNPMTGAKSSIEQRKEIGIHEIEIDIMGGGHSPRHSLWLPAWPPGKIQSRSMSFRIRSGGPSRLHRAGFSLIRRLFVGPRAPELLPTGLSFHGTPLSIRPAASRSRNCFTARSCRSERVRGIGAIGSKLLDRDRGRTQSPL